MQDRQEVSRRPGEPYLPLNSGLWTGREKTQARDWRQSGLGDWTEPSASAGACRPMALGVAPTVAAPP